MTSSTSSTGITRRQALAALGGTGLALAGLSLVGPARPALAAGSAASDVPTLRVGLSGSATDSLDPAASNALHVPYAEKFNCLDCLALLDSGKVTMRLATAFDVNDDATEWTVTLRDDAKFHDGSPVTAKDVLYSLRYIGESPVGTMNYASVDWDASTTDGDHKVVLKLKQPQATLVETGLAAFSFVFPEGTKGEDFSQHDVGSGPYKLESFDPDSGTVLVANEDYWDGAPSIKRIELIPMADAATRMQALTSGQIDYADGVSATDAATVEGNDAFTLLSGGAVNSAAYEFVLNCAKPPFDDVEVRKAFKEVVDRDTLVTTIFRGQGEAGNDVVGKGLPGYDDQLQPHTVDVEAAKKVFADKGVTSLDVLTAEVVPGIKDSVTLLAQQLQAVGVTLNVTDVDPSTIYTSNAGMISQTQVFATYYINRPFPMHAPLYTAGTSPYNFSAWNDDAYNALLGEISTTPDADARQDLLDQAQQLLWEQGGDVVWGFAYDLAVHTSKLSGVKMSQSLPLFAQAKLA